MQRGPKPGTPVVQDGVLTFQEDGEQRSLKVGTPAWFAWLQTATKFHYVTDNISYRVRKEHPPQVLTYWYWRAYRTSGRKIYRLYVGKVDAVTDERLQAIAAEFQARQAQP